MSKDKQNTDKDKDIYFEDDSCCNKPKIEEEDCGDPISDEEIFMGDSSDNVFAEELNKLKSDLAAISKKAEEAQNNYLRTMADLDNFRKRAARERQEYIRTAASAVIESLLPILDNFGHGLESAKKHPEANAVTHGFEMIAQQLIGALAENGLQSIKPNPGDSFDTALHDAISAIPNTEIPDGKIVAVTRVGYKLNDKLLRPAAVVVAKND